MQSSRRDLFNDVAEHRAILKNNRNTYYPRFDFIPKTGIAFPEMGVLFLLWATDMVSQKLSSVGTDKKGIGNYLVLVIIRYRK